jgi:hypothetical protein
MFVLLTKRRAPNQDARYFQLTMPLFGNENVLVERYRQALWTQREFVIAVVGTSNAACHDTKVATCFPTYFADDFRSVFDRFGVKVVLRNQAMGGTNSIPASMCLKVRDCFLSDSSSSQVSSHRRRTLYRRWPAMTLMCCC